MEKPKIRLKPSLYYSSLNLPLIYLFSIMSKSPFASLPPSLFPSQPKRDTRRSFTSSQKKQILYQQDNKCARCHEKLDPSAIQFDHKKPWSSGGRTITVNGRALCSKCHDIISHEERLKKTDKKNIPLYAHSFAP